MFAHLRFPGGEYPNQAPPECPVGLVAWTTDREPQNLVSADIVLWHVFGVTHVPRLEDWPVMPCETTGFSIKPVGFFDASPCMDVADAKEAGAECGPGVRLIIVKKS